MYVLDKLWRGKLSPHEQCFNYGSEYNTLYQAMNAKATEIAACLSEEGKQLFQGYQAIRDQMSAISEEDVFVNGFRIGVGLMLDAVGTYESQFVRYHDD